MTHIKEHFHGEGFGSVSVASAMRDVMERVAEGVVKRLRPEPFLAKVYDVDTVTQKCRVLPLGQSSADGLLTVRYALDKIPRNVMVDQSELGDEALADIVRVQGYSGSFFILDFFAGSPWVPGENEGFALHNDPSFDVTPWFSGYPDGWSSFWNSGTWQAFQEGSDVLDGNYSLKVVRGSGATTRVHMRLPMSVVPGKAITISIWAKASVAGASIELGFLTNTTAGTAEFFSGASFQTITQPTNTAWTKHEVTYVVPATHTFGRITFLLHNSAAVETTFFVDDSFSKYAETVPFISVDGSDYGGQPNLFLNGWVNYDAGGAGGNTQARYRKVGDIVYVEGLVKNGTLSATILQLPAGYRPGSGQHFATANNGVFAFIRVFANGNLDVQGTTNSWTSIHCYFKAEG